jgi:hypothetical protein
LGPGGRRGELQLHFALQRVGGRAALQLEAWQLQGLARSGYKAPDPAHSLQVLAYSGRTPLLVLEKGTYERP